MPKANPTHRCPVCNRVMQRGEGVLGTMLECPLHAQAPRMLKALQRMEDVLDTLEELGVLTSAVDRLLKVNAALLEALETFIRSFDATNGFGDGPDGRDDLAYVVEIVRAAIIAAKGESNG